jgi:hemin uptake protein HemP
MHIEEQTLTHYTPSLELSTRRMKSIDLLKSGRELLIEHGDQIYRLIKTSNDKLLLVK